MNGQKIYELMLDGAYLMNWQFFHPSFKKGWRKMSPYNISFQAALRKAKNDGRNYEYIKEEQKYIII